MMETSNRPIRDSEPCGVRVWHEIRGGERPSGVQARKEYGSAGPVNGLQGGARPPRAS